MGPHVISTLPAWFSHATRAIRPASIHGTCPLVTYICHTLHAVFPALLLSPAPCYPFRPALAASPCLASALGGSMLAVEGGMWRRRDIWFWSDWVACPVQHCTTMPVPPEARVGCHSLRIHISCCPCALSKHQMTRLVRQSVYHHPRGHRSILGPGRVHTSNICSRRSGSIRS